MSFNKAKIKGKNCIIWTRSLEDWPADRLLLEASGHSYIHLPCFQTRRLNKPELSPTVLVHPRKVAVFTSLRAGVHALECEGVLDFLRDARIFCFGDKVRLFLENENFQVELFEGIRSASEIPSLLEKKLHPESFVLLPGPKKRAFALDFALLEKGFRTQSIDLYETIPSLKISDDEKQDLISNLNGTVFFASPSACLGFVESLVPHTNRLGFYLSALALGPSTSEVCRRYFANVHVASHNSIERALNIFSQDNAQPNIQRNQEQT